MRLDQNEASEENSARMKEPCLGIMKIERKEGNWVKLIARIFVTIGIAVVISGIIKACL